MNKRNGWLRQDIASGMAMLHESHRCGVFVVRFDRQPGAGDGRELGSARNDRRVSRSLQTLALRFGRLSGAVVGWTMADSLLIVTASWQEDAEGLQDGSEASAGKLSHLLQDTAIKLFSAPRKGNRRLEGSFRCGFGPIDRPARSGDGGNSDDLWEHEILRGVEAAVKAMFLSPAVALKMPMMETRADESEMAVHYAPILSLLDGSLYGYEAIPIFSNGGGRVEIGAFYDEAMRAGTLYESDRRFREAAIRGFPSKSGDVKLFLPVPVQVIYDARMHPGSTLRKIESAGLRPEHVVLVLVGAEEEGQTAAAKAALSHYRLQGFRISLSGITPSRSSLRRMVELHPEYAQASVGWLRSDGPDSVEESLLQAMTALARKEQIVLIADRIDRESLLPSLVASGMNYGQGEWIGKERAGASGATFDVQSRIRKEVNRRYRGASGSLSELASQAQQFGRQTPVSEISRHFELHREAQAIVVADEGKPIGLLMKEKLHQLLSGQFGLPLYWNRPVGKIMDAFPMIVDESMPVDQVSQMAMAREPDKLYDAVIVTRGGLFASIVSIRAMLEWVTSARMTDAQWANPLTGLPGNEPIRRELIRRLASERPFAIWYADLDHFKWFNDHYGFHKGDEVIRYTGELLSSVVGARAQASGDCFIGHIGGDDFIVLTDGSDPLAAAREVLDAFGLGIGAFAGEPSGPVLDRSGRKVDDANGLSLSLSVLVCEANSGWSSDKVSERAAMLKKRAKASVGNSLVWEIAAPELTAT